MNSHTTRTLFAIGILLSLVAIRQVPSEDIKIGVILPFRGRYPWVLNKTRPALEYAIEAVLNDTALLQGYNITTAYRDSLCSETEGPLAAIDMYTEKLAHVFIGPACDYSVAPIARFSYKWGIPLISAGALVSAFHDKAEYKLLTRIQGSYAKAGESFLALCFANQWRKIGLLYHDFKNDPNRVKSDCFFTLEAIYLALVKTLGIQPWHKSFDQTKNVGDFEDLLIEAAEHTRSKIASHVLYSQCCPVVSLDKHGNCVSIFLCNAICHLEIL